MDIRCPCCHSQFNLEHVTEDEALREMMALLADLPRDVSRPLVAYVGLFRGKTRATAYERQLRLSREALALASDTSLVGAAMSETVEAIRAKRETGQDTRPLKNHNYLKSVLVSLGARAEASQAMAGVEGQPPQRPAKGVMRALQALDQGRQS
ncbi:hypothetical protein [Halomonas saccharevitans]|uniref:Uncharacterized protein n=1 Tax=Halomonas saccharevitans TaxID=416872 RepID=A0A1I7AGX0_9GAMM|nr:hypothetical protein [Halomonas saccharevitans]SFT74110.1 hypothetical protein SAMN04487956_11770 [Halomonas saccharevitans]